MPLSHFAAVCLICLSTVALSQAQPLDQPTITRLTDAALPAALSQLTDFLAIPNDGNYPEQVEANLAWCRENFMEKGYTVTRLETPGMPLLFAERQIHQDLPTVLFYLQIDGQPVDTSAWDQPDPYQVVYKRREQDGSYTTVSAPANPARNSELRLFARSASDSKGPAPSLHDRTRHPGS